MPQSLDGYYKDRYEDLKQEMADQARESAMQQLSQRQDAQSQLEQQRQFDRDVSKYRGIPKPKAKPKTNKAKAKAWLDEIVAQVKKPKKEPRPEEFYSTGLAGLASGAVAQDVTFAPGKKWGGI